MCSNLDFRAALFGALDQPRLRHMVVDLREVWFLSACGIGTLAEIHTHATAVEIALCVVADSCRVLRPLQITGMDRILDIRPDHGDAPP